MAACPDSWDSSTVLQRSGSRRRNTNLHVDDLEVLLQPMSDKDHPDVQQAAQLLVGGFERGKVLGGGVGVQLQGLDARELCQVVGHLERRHVTAFIKSHTYCTMPVTHCIMSVVYTAGGLSCVRWHYTTNPPHTHPHAPLFSKTAFNNKKADTFLTNVSFYK